MKTPKIVRLLVWLRRIGHCKGFGIQSPRDYSLATEVINQRLPYYAYATLAARYPDIDRMRRKKNELSLRIANLVQPTRILCVNFIREEKEQVEAYLHAGCKNAKLKSTRWDERTTEDSYSWLDEDDGPHLLYIDAYEFSCEYMLDTMHKHLRDGDYILVDNMNAKEYVFGALRDRLHGIVSFDMYYCGLIYVDSKRYKQNYIINF